MGVDCSEFWGDQEKPADGNGGKPINRGAEQTGFERQYKYSNVSGDVTVSLLGPWNFSRKEGRFQTAGLGREDGLSWEKAAAGRNRDGDPERGRSPGSFSRKDSRGRHTLL